MSVISAGSYSRYVVVSTAMRHVISLIPVSIVAYFRWQLFVDTDDDAMRPGVTIIYSWYLVCTAVRRHTSHHDVPSPVASSASSLNIPNILLVSNDSDDESRDRPGRTPDAICYKTPLCPGGHAQTNTRHLGYLTTNSHVREPDRRGLIKPSEKLA